MSCINNKRERERDSFIQKVLAVAKLMLMVNVMEMMEEAAL